MKLPMGMIGVCLLAAILAFAAAKAFVYSFERAMKNYDKARIEQCKAVGEMLQRDWRYISGYGCFAKDSQGRWILQ